MDPREVGYGGWHWESAAQRDWLGMVLGAQGALEPHAHYRERWSSGESLSAAAAASAGVVISLEALS